MSAKKFLLPVGAAVVLAGGAAAGYWYFNKMTMKDSVTPLTLAKVVPDEAYMATFVTSDLQAWAKLQDFGTPEARKLLENGLKGAEKDLLAKNKIDFEKDIKPWVGNSMLAMLPSESSKKPTAVLVVSIRDKVSALNFALKLAGQSDGKKGKEIEYKGTKIYADEAGNTFVTLVNDYLVVASEQNAIERAIDTTQGAASLASKPEAAGVLQQSVDLKNQVAQIYLMDYANAVQQMANTTDNPKALEDKTLQQLKNVKSMIAGIGIDDEGIRFKAIAKMDPNAPKIDYKPAPGKIVTQFPAETMALVNGANLSHYWTQAIEQSKRNPDSQQVLDQMRQSVKSADFDLDKDFFSWMDGEFGVGLIPSDRGILAQVGFGGVMVFDTSDRKTAEATLGKLDQFAKSNGSGMLQVQQRDVQGKKVTEWNTPYGSVLGHGWLDDDSMFVALGGPMVDVATSKPGQPLANSETFKASTASLPKQNLGYVYVDMDKTMAIVNKFTAMSQSPIPAEPAAVLNSIKGIGMTSTQVDASTGQFEMLLALKKVAK